jgi:hypothetical protein
MDEVSIADSDIPFSYANIALVVGRRLKNSILRDWGGEGAWINGEPRANLLVRQYPAG